MWWWNSCILAGVPASGGLTCYGASYARQQSISCTCMESPIQLRKNVICLNWRLDYLVMPLSFVFLPVYILLANISNTACSSNTRA